MVITFCLIRILVVVPYANAFDTALTFNDWHFIVLIIVTMLSASAGNIVNNIYDVEIDQVNKPEKVFINRIVYKKNAWLFFLY
jgi:4-hydroxybenzoate polyprenyltransferase